MRLAWRLRVQRRLDHRLNFLRGNGFPTPRTRGIMHDATHTLGCKTLAPQQHRGPADSQFSRNGQVGLSIGCAQDDACPLRNLLRCGSAGFIWEKMGLNGLELFQNCGQNSHFQRQPDAQSDARSAAQACAGRVN